LAEIKSSSVKLQLYGIEPGWTLFLYIYMKTKWNPLL